ncbi:MAG: hypothetical protein CME16_06155 [Gemmatimonadetes bacterium]|nr:hypothetical protein [Gemmatimonadota bacterium]
MANTQRLASSKRGLFAIVLVRVFGKLNSFCHYGVPSMADWQEKWVAELVRQILKENSESDLNQRALQEWRG